MTDEHQTRVLPGRGCVRGHDARPAPDVDPVLGLVPARTSCWFGAVILGIVAGLLLWLLPAGLRPWVGVVLVAWFAVVVLVQLALGHRGRCLWRRSVRWFFGPVGALIDPFDSD